MAGRKKGSSERGRVDLKAPPEWIKRASAAAEELGFGTLSGLIRFAVTKYLNETLPQQPPGKKGGK
jgi:hypothetical protein